MKKLSFKTSYRQETMLHTTAYRSHRNFLRVYTHSHSAVGSGSKYALTLNNKTKLTVSQNPFTPAVTFTECFYR